MENHHGEVEIITRGEKKGGNITRHCKVGGGMGKEVVMQRGSDAKEK